MSSMKTANLGLHIWNDTDYVDFEEMNENFQKIDSIAPDFIVASGKNGIWNWKKWNSGIVELEGSEDVEVSEWLPYKTDWYVAKESPVFPFTVNGAITTGLVPYISTRRGSGAGLYYTCAFGGEATDRIYYYLMSSSNEDTFTGSIRFRVIGRWK